MAGTKPGHDGASPRQHWLLFRPPLRCSPSSTRATNDGHAPIVRASPLRGRAPQHDDEHWSAPVHQNEILAKYGSSAGSVETIKNERSCRACSKFQEEPDNEENCNRS